MIQLLLIVVPCTIVGTVTVLLAQRVGWLPQLEESGPQPYTPSPRRRGPSRPLAVGAIVLMCAWILLWIGILVVGLSVISAAS
jgi:hypothetical protein